VIGEYLGQPVPPEASSLPVDWFLALPIPKSIRAGAKLVSLHTQGWSAWVQGQGTGRSLISVWALLAGRGLENYT